MSLGIVRFVVVMLAALSLSFSVGHLMQLPARMGWDQYLWVGSTLQGGFYRLSGPLGVFFQIATLIGLIVLALIARLRHGSGLALTGAALLFALGMLFWWILVYPVNLELTKWVNGPVPDNWMEWRKKWEWGQAANGVSQLLGFAVLVASVVLKPDWLRRR